MDATKFYLTRKLNIQINLIIFLCSFDNKNIFKGLFVKLNIILVMKKKSLPVFNIQPTLFCT